MAKSGSKGAGGAKGCWFSKCTTEQLSALLKACGLPRSGVKADLVARLRGHAAAAEYGAEARAPVLSRATCELVGGRGAQHQARRHRRRSSAACAPRRRPKR